MIVITTEATHCTGHRIMCTGSDKTARSQFGQIKCSKNAPQEFIIEQSETPIQEAEQAGSARHVKQSHELVTAAAENEGIRNNTACGMCSRD